MRADTLKALVEARAAKEAVLLATALGGDSEILISLADLEAESTDLPENVQAEALAALMSDKARTVEADGQKWFLNPFNPPLRLIIIGAVHISQPLAAMAGLAGYDVTIIDPREAFASPERFPDTAYPNLTLVCAWPDEALAELKLDTRSALVTVTHDPKLDDPALHVGLRSPAFYIGALGSKKTQGARVERLKQAGFSDNEIGRIHGPIGLAIGARSPAEIAVSILAEMTETLRT